MARVETPPDEFFGGIWWRRTADGGWRDAISSECDTEIQRLRAELARRQSPISIPDNVAMRCMLEVMRDNPGAVSSSAAVGAATWALARIAHLEDLLASGRILPAPTGEHEA